jgi:RecB family endonuclease NucS
VDGGFIDLLLIDRTEQLVVVELKVGRGRNKTIGQLLYYMGWIDKNLAKAQCRGMIIAKEISDDLLVAVRRVPGVSLHRYILSVSVQPISGEA